MQPILHWNEMNSCSLIWSMGQLTGVFECAHVNDHSRWSGRICFAFKQHVVLVLSRWAGYLKGIPNTSQGPYWHCLGTHLALFCCDKFSFIFVLYPPSTQKCIEHNTVSVRHTKIGLKMMPKLAKPGKLPYTARVRLYLSARHNWLPYKVITWNSRKLLLWYWQQLLASFKHRGSWWWCFPVCEWPAVSWHVEDVGGGGGVVVVAKAQNREQTRKKKGRE